MDFVEICNVCARKAIIKVAKRKINSNKICSSYSDLNFGVTFLEHSVDVSLTMGSTLCYKTVGFLHFYLSLYKAA